MTAARMIFLIGMVTTFTGYVIAMSTKREKRDLSILSLFCRTKYGQDIWWLKKWVWGLALMLSGIGLLFASLQAGRRPPHPERTGIPRTSSRLQ